MKAIATVNIDTKVGIYDNCTISIRVHADRTLIREPYVRWIGNTGGYAEANHRITGKAHERFLAAIKKAAEDEVDVESYIERVYADMSEQMYFA